VHGLADCICCEPALVRELLGRHVNLTDSRRGKQLLETWEQAVRQILRVRPKAVDMPKPPVAA
jgi:glutamate synthase domain-containing protein 3